MPQWFTDYWHQHGVVGVLAAWVIFSTTLNLAFRLRSPENWVVWADANPKAHLVVELLRGWGVDPASALKALQNYAALKATKADKEEEEKALQPVTTPQTEIEVEEESEHL